MAGVIPVIFASSLLYLPALSRSSTSPTARPGRLGGLDQRAPRHAATTRSTSPSYFALIVFFTYFYVAITFNPTEVADNMKKYGGFIPGIRAGRPTAEYLDYVLSPHHPAGRAVPRRRRADPAVALVLVNANQNFPFGGTSILIIVGVGLETVKQIESQLQQRQLRRVPPLSAARHSSARPAPARARRRSSSRRTSASRRSPPATSSAPTSSQGTELGLEAKEYMDAGDLRARRGHQRHGRDRLAEADAASGFLLDGYPRTVAGRGARRDARRDRRRSTWCWSSPSTTRRSSPAVRATDLPTVRPRLAPDFDPPRRGSCDGAAASSSSATTTPRRSSGTASEVYAEQTAPLIDYYGERGLLRGSRRHGRDRGGHRARDRRAAPARRPERRRATRVQERERDRVQDRRPGRGACARPGLVVGRRPGAVAGRRRAGRHHRRRSTPSPRIDPPAPARRPSFQGYGHPPFPASICISVNDEVVHGIPGPARAARGRPGLDRLRRRSSTAGTATPRSPSRSATVAPTSSTELSRVSRGRPCGHGIAAAAGRRPARRHRRTRSRPTIAVAGADYGIVEEYAGHGIGTAMHQDAARPQLRAPATAGPRLVPGLCLAVEPMVTSAPATPDVLDDDWTVVTADGSRGGALGAHGRAHRRRPVGAHRARRRRGRLAPRAAAPPRSA